MQMRKTLIALVTAGIVVALGTQALAQGSAVEVRYTDQDGARRGAHLPSVKSLGAGCSAAPVGRPPDGARTEIEVILSRTSDRGTGTVIRQPDGRAWLLGRDGALEQLGICLASDELLTALDNAQRVPSTRGPWAFFVAMVAGLAFVIMVTAALGAGRGPRPAMGTAVPDAHGPPQPEPEPGEERMAGAEAARSPSPAEAAVEAPSKAEATEDPRG